LSSPSSASRSSAGSINSAGAPRWRSLRDNSIRPCSRRASKSIAARRTAGGLSSTATMGSDVGVRQIFGYRGGLGIGRSHQQLGANLLFDLLADLRVLFQILGRIGLALADLAALVGVPGTGFLHQALLHAEIDDLAVAVDALAVEDLELGLAERRGHLVLDDLDAGFAAHHFVAFLHSAGTADVQTDRSVELKRVTAGGGFRAAEHHAELHADLVDEDHQAVGVLEVAGDL